MKKSLSVLALVGVMLAVSPEAHAARGAVMAACKADVQNYCSTVEKGGGKIAKCLKSHESEVSASCKSALEKVAAAHQAKHPKGVQPAAQSSAPSSEPAPAASEAPTSSSMPADSGSTNE